MSENVVAPFDLDTAIGREAYLDIYHEACLQAITLGTRSVSPEHRTTEEKNAETYYFELISYTDNEPAVSALRDILAIPKKEEYAERFNAPFRELRLQVTREEEDENTSLIPRVILRLPDGHMRMEPISDTSALEEQLSPHGEELLEFFEQVTQDKAPTALWGIYSDQESGDFSRVIGVLGTYVWNDESSPGVSNREIAWSILDRSPLTLRKIVRKAFSFIGLAESIADPLPIMLATAQLGVHLTRAPRKSLLIYPYSGI